MRKSRLCWCCGKVKEPKFSYDRKKRRVDFCKDCTEKMFDNKKSWILVCDKKFRCVICLLEEKQKLGFKDKTKISDICIDCHSEMIYIEGCREKRMGEIFDTHDEDSLAFLDLGIGDFPRDYPGSIYN